MKSQRNYRRSKCPVRDESSLQDRRRDVDRRPFRINLNKFYEKSSVGECDIYEKSSVGECDMGNFKTLRKIGSEESNESSSDCTKKKAISNNEKVINNGFMEGLENERMLKKEYDRRMKAKKPRYDDEDVNQEKPFYGWSRETEPRCGMPWVEQDYSRYDLRTSFTLVPAIDNASLGPSAEATLLSESKVSFSHNDLTLEQENYGEDEDQNDQTVKEEIEDDDEIQILKVIQCNPKTQLTSMVSVQAEVKTERRDFDMRSNMEPRQNVTIDRQGGTVIMEKPRDAIVMERPHDVIKMEASDEDNQSSVKIKLSRKTGKWVVHDEDEGNKAKRFRSNKHGENETNRHGEGKTNMHREGESNRHGEGETNRHGEGEINSYGEGNTNGEDETINYSDGEDKIDNCKDNGHDRSQCEKNINNNSVENNNSEVNVNLKNKEDEFNNIAKITDGPHKESTPDGPLNGEVIPSFAQKIKSKENVTVKIDSAEVKITDGGRTVEMKTTGGCISGQADDVKDIVKTLAQVVHDL